MITIIASSNRNNSKSLRIAEFIAHQLQIQKMPVQILSLKELPHDFIFSHFDGNVNEKMQQIINEKIIAADKFIFVVPEYNGSFPGILKAFIDCVPPKCFYGKKAALVGLADGHSGALRALDMFTLVLHYVRVNVHWNKPKLSDIANKFNTVLDENYQKRIIDLLNDFIH